MMIRFTSLKSEENFDLDNDNPIKGGGSHDLIIKIMEEIFSVM